MPPSAPPGGSTARRLIRLLGYGIIAAILGFLIQRLIRDWDTVRELRVWERPWLLAAHLALLVATFAGLAAGWHLVLRANGCPLPFRGSCLTWLTPNLGKYVPGKVLMFAGRVELCRLSGIRRAAALTAVIVEHLMQVLGALPFVVLAMALDGGPRPTGVVVAAGVILTVALGILAWPDGLRRGIDWLLRRLRRKALTGFPSRPALLLLLLLYACVWTAYGLGGTALVHAAGIQSVPGRSAVAAWVAAWAIGFLSIFSPGGLGVREGALVLLLSPYLPVPEAVAVTLLSRLTWVLIEVLGVLLGLFLARDVTSAAREIRLPGAEESS
jgi:hypothetical protein